MTTPQLPGTNPYLYGIHEPCPPDVLPPGKGWILFLEEVGHSPEPHPGTDFGEWERQGYGVICRIQHAWGDGGTLPPIRYLEGYVERVRTLVANSRFCHRWIIGNEPNLPVEWAKGFTIWPTYAARCYNRCWSAIHDLPGHEMDEVLTAPIGPWNDQIGIGWVEYFQQMIAACEFVDGFATHAYVHGSDPALITSEAMMNAPYQDRHYEFRTYRDWMNAIPSGHRGLPVYLTETNQDGAWLDEQNGWIPEMYREIDEWNHSGAQVIRCAILYRYPHYDPYYIDGKWNVIADLHRAIERGYTWAAPEPPVERRTLEVRAVLKVDGVESGVFEGTLTEV